MSLSASGGRGKDGRTGREGGRKRRRARRGKKESGEGRASYKTRDGHGDDGGQSLEYGNTAPGRIPPANGSPTAANPLLTKQPDALLPGLISPSALSAALRSPVHSDDAHSTALVPSTVRGPVSPSAQRLHLLFSSPTLRSGRSGFCNSDRLTRAYSSRPAAPRA